jgi:transcriptional regulator with XRE-family HTH domain
VSDSSPSVASDYDAFDDPYDLDLGDEDFIDEIAVELRMAGDRRVALNPKEAYAAFSGLEAKGLSAGEIAERLGVAARTVVRWRNGHTDTIRLRGASSMTTPSTSSASPLALLLEEASGHGSKRVRRLAEKIEGHLDDLRALIAQDAEKEQARQEVIRLERALAEAKAKLRGGTVTAITASGTKRTRNVDPLPCRKGCGASSAGAAGRSAHERHCTYEAVAS